MPPWHYSSECLVVEYWADPSAIAGLLPPGVAIDKKTNGRAFFWFLDWQFTGSNDELTNFAQCQYREAFVLLEAIFEGMPVNYCPCIFSDSDAAIARAWGRGFPKKLATIFQTRTFPAPGPASAPLASGSRFGGSLAVRGKRLAAARVQLEEPVGDPSAVFHRPMIVPRYLPLLGADCHGQPALGGLAMSLTDNLAMRNVWSGAAELTISDVGGEELCQLEPLCIGRGFRLCLSYSVTDLRVLKDYAQEPIGSVI